jgi:hypothetical protein
MYRVEIQALLENKSEIAILTPNFDLLVIFTG